MIRTRYKGIAADIDKQLGRPSEEGRHERRLQNQSECGRGVSGGGRCPGLATQGGQGFLLLSLLWVLGGNCRKELEFGI